MPFPPRSLLPPLVAKLNRFSAATNFRKLYQTYDWKGDTHANGFPDIYCLESRLMRSDRTTGVTLEDVKAVARWGALRNRKRILGKAVVAPRNTFHNRAGASPPILAATPLRPLAVVRGNLFAGIGPTYISKVLRFALPQEYGAIDTRCVRVFGIGDKKSSRHRWLALLASRGPGGWYLTNSQKQWPAGYSLWINILRHFAATLAPDCPHPPAFVAGGLRRLGVWECADVEMALFSYASRYT
jgi:hypothetical protein